MPHQQLDNNPQPSRCALTAALTNTREMALSLRLFKD